MTPSALALLALSAAAPSVWLILLTDGLYVLLLLAGAAGWGAAALAPFRMRMPSLLGFCAALGLGLGLMGWAALGLGCAGWMSTPAAWLLVLVGIGLALAALVARSSRRGHALRAVSPGIAISPDWGAALLLAPLAIPLAILLLGACLPPGLLWEEEAGGYDVLEYHLQAPREYVDRGAIAFLPHNVYASFPQQVEILYYLLMHLLGDVHAAAIPSQLLHAAMGVLAALAAGGAALTRPRDAAGGLERFLPAAAVLLVGSTPWVAYLGALAYVESGILLYALLAGGMLLAAKTVPDGQGARCVALAGVFAGLATGCKYTAGVLVLAGLGAAWVALRGGGLRLSVRDGLIYGTCGLLALSPWLARNWLQAGNPVHPFAYRVFGGAAWSAEQDAQWQRGHQLPAQEASLSGRAFVAARELLGVQRPADAEAYAVRITRFGPVLLLVGLAACLLSGTVGRWCGLWALGMLLTWALLTHMPGRFLACLIAPLALALGRWSSRRRWVTGGLLLMVWFGAWVNGFSLWRLWSSHAQRWQQRVGFAMTGMLGATDALAASWDVNTQTPPDARLWLVGEAAVYYARRPIHYTVVFSRDPWLTAAQGASPQEAVAWLRQRGYTHVVFDWNEIWRLQRTYGFPTFVTPDWAASLEAGGLRRAPAQPQQDLRSFDLWLTAQPAP